MSQDSFVQVAPDGAGKTVDMSLTSTAAGSAIYRQRAELVGDSGTALIELLTTNQNILVVLRAILATLTATTNTQTSEEDFIYRDDFTNQL